MKASSTTTFKWVHALVIMSFLSLMFSASNAQFRHPRFHRDSIFFKIRHAGDSLWRHFDSTHVFHRDSFPRLPHDSGHTWHDSFPRRDSVWFDSLRHRFPPHDSLPRIDSAWLDSLFHHLPPPPPHDSGHTWRDSFPPIDSTWLDSLHHPFPPHDSIPCDTGRFHRHRLGLLGQASISVSIYPNPVVAYATIHVANASENVLFRMFDMNGRLVNEMYIGNGDMQLTKPGTGLYYYEILDGNAKVSDGKLIFQ